MTDKLMGHHSIFSGKAALAQNEGRKTYSCLLCGSRTFENFRKYKSVTPDFASKQIVRCASCSFLSVYPLLSQDELNKYYTTYWQREESDEAVSLFKEQAEARFEFMAPYIPGEETVRIVDVGAGFGAISEVFQKRLSAVKVFYNAVELDPIAVSRLKEKISPEHIFSDIDQTRVVYNVAIIAHLLEHVLSPLDLLKKQRDRLSNNGIVFIELPNQDYRFKIKNEPHLYFFSPETTIRLIEKAGYKILRIDTCGMELDYLSKNSSKPEIVIKFKAIFRKIAPKFLSKFMAARLRLCHNYRNPKFVSNYGTSRQWIRVVAQKV